MAEFDTVKFLDTLLGTITTISKSMVIDMGSSTPPVAELCSTVRAARLEVKKDILDENSHGKYGETNPLCFTNENYDPENFYVVQHIGTEFVFADYYFYQYKGDTPFTEEEKKAWLAQMSDVTVGSDAFFPFSDNIERAKKSGVKYIAEPGGSVRDDLVIDTCNKYGMVMAFTGIRLFHH